jgi:hypothetical protein
LQTLPVGAPAANFVVAPVSASGAITIYDFSGSVNVIVDMAGWYS